MYVLIIQKILQQQKLESIFLVDIQCQQFGDHIEDKLTLCCGIDFMKKFCTFTRRVLYFYNINYFEKEKMLSIAKEELKSHKDAKVWYICGKGILEKLFKSINYRSVWDHCHETGKYRGAAHAICNSKFNIPNEIPAVFHNGSSYDDYFIIKEIPNEFEGQFECLGKNTEK